MRCDGCGASVFEGDAACSECGRELPERKSAPSQPIPVIESEPEAIEPPPAPAPAARCAEHVEAMSVATCTRCGRFCCRECFKSNSTCTACERLTVEPRLRRELKISFFFIFAVVFALGVVMPISLNASGALLIGGSVFSVAMLGCAILFAITESTVFATIAVILEASVALTVTIIVEGKCLSWPLIAFPIVTVFRLAKWRRLKADR